MTDYNNMSDEALASLCKNQDVDAWDLLVKRYMPIVRLIANSMRNCTESEKDDFISDGIYKGLFSAVKNFDDTKSKFSTFASHCIKNAILNTVEKKNSKKRIPVELCLPADAIPEGVYSDTNYKVELYEVTNSFDSILTEKEKKCFILHLNGYSYSEIATRIETTEKAVEKAISRARKKIQENFK